MNFTLSFGAIFGGRGLNWIFLKSSALTFLPVLWKSGLLILRLLLIFRILRSTWKDSESLKPLNLFWLNLGFLPPLTGQTLRLKLFRFRSTLNITDIRELLFFGPKGIYKSLIYLFSLYQNIILKLLRSYIDKILLKRE